MKRGVEHFRDVGSHLENEAADLPDQYRERAEAAMLKPVPDWRKGAGRPGSLDFEEEG